MAEDSQAWRATLALSTWLEEFFVSPSAAVRGSLELARDRPDMAADERAAFIEAALREWPVWNAASSRWRTRSTPKRRPRRRAAIRTPRAWNWRLVLDFGHDAVRYAAPAETEAGIAWHVVAEGENPNRYPPRDAALAHVASECATAAKHRRSP